MKNAMPVTSSPSIPVGTSLSRGGGDGGGLLVTDCGPVQHGNAQRRGTPAVTPLSYTYGVLQHVAVAEPRQSARPRKCLCACVCE